MARPNKTHDPFRWFDSSPEVIRLVVMMKVKYPLSLRNVEDLLYERCIDICHEAVRHWWNRFGSIFCCASRLAMRRISWTDQRISSVEEVSRSRLSFLGASGR